MEKRQRSFHVNRGIWQFNPHDYYAVLGVPVTADVIQIRRGYLNIVKLLHPDVCTNFEKDLATQYLSKIVNPAYTLLIQEKERDEYSIILKLLAKQLIKKGENISPHSEEARRLIHYPNAASYEKSVMAIAQIQYTSFDQVLEYSVQLSELNLVYVMVQEGYKPTILSTANASYPNHVNLNQNQTPKPQAPKNQVNLAEEYIAQKQWMLAIKELKNYLQSDNNNSRCHALLGFSYMNQKLDGMARVCFQQALKINPEEPLALQNINKVGASKSQIKDDSPKKGGFFGWLGGG